MSYTLCTSGAATYKSGKYATSAVLGSETILNNFSDDAEGFVEQATNTDWVSNFAALSTSIKQALSDIVSSLIAMKIISYDMGAYSSMREAETLLDINDNIATKGILNLKGKADRRKAP